MALAESYDCSTAGVRCFDGHSGRVFVKSGDYIDGVRLYQRVSASTNAKIHMFVRAECAPALLDGLTLSTTNRKRLDQITQGGPAKSISPQNEQANQKAQNDITSAMKDIDKSPGDSKTLDALQKHLDNNALLDPTTREALKKHLDEAVKAGLNNPDAAKKELTKAAMLVATLKPPAFRAGHAAVSAKTFLLPIPSDDTIDVVQITVQNLVKRTALNGDAENDASGKQFLDQQWPTSEFDVQVDHGRYFFDYGIMFAAIYHGKRVTMDQDSTSLADCDRTCKTDVKTMLTLEYFPLGRPRAVLSELRNLFPGVQFGINADLGNVKDAFSIGLVVEPIGGLAISAGTMLVNRLENPRSAMSDDNKEYRWVPYIGISLSSDIVTTIKKLGGEATPQKDLNQ